MGPLYLTLVMAAQTTYYVYGFDGKLLAEYDQAGNCMKDYLYVGSKLVAEYQPASGKYYYYMSDQVNSTRLVTDDVGTVVHSVTYDPYGGPQKTWVKTYEPKLKFSGKEREIASELDYFGARYYDHIGYRFISVDPIINKEGALANPQLWNLYSYCKNNPITFLDPDGKEDKKPQTREGKPEDMPKPPGCNEDWKFKPSGHYNPDDPEQQPGHYIDDKGRKWQWDPHGREHGGEPHWDVDKPIPGESKKWDKDPRNRERYRPDGTRLIDNDKSTVIKKSVFISLGAAAVFFAPKIIRLFIPGFQWTVFLPI